MTTSTSVSPPSVTGEQLVPPVADAPALVSARDLTRNWGRGSNTTIGVDRIHLDLGRGALVAIVGPSGSGKSTLGALIAGIDRPSSGSLVIDGVRTDSLRNDALARWRAEHVGIVFQDFHLLPTLTAQENIELALRFADRRLGRSTRSDRARRALGKVGLAGLEGRLPASMSGGEQQRVAIARAIVAEPALVVADEPTGSLDQATGHQVFDLLRTLRDSGTTVVFITHDPSLAERCDRIVEMLDGRVDGVRAGTAAVA
ncbi:MAG: ABC transporter ATP-binding protein [Ilumatobacter sp.]